MAALAGLNKKGARTLTSVLKSRKEESYIN
jgi:hypothetical protein